MKENVFWIWLVIVTLILLIVIVVGVGYFKGSEGYYTYEGKNGEFIYQKVDFGEIVQYKFRSNVLLNNEGIEYSIFLRNSPVDVESVELEDVRESLLEGGIRKIYVTQDYNLPNLTEKLSTVAVIEFGRILGTNQFGLYGVPTQSAYTTLEGLMGDYKIPVKTCSDIGDGVKVIYLKLGSSNRVYMEKECVIIEGVDGYGLVLSADKFAYHLLGVF